MFAPDVEFYHDKADPQYGRDVVMGNIRKAFCEGGTRRELVAGSIEAYRIQKIGAVEIGVHRFYHVGEHVSDGTGEAKFIHLWRYNNGQWQILRVISYAHRSTGK